MDQRIEARLQSEHENELDDERVRSYIMSLVGGGGANQNNQTNNGNLNSNTSSVSVQASGASNNAGSNSLRSILRRRTGNGN